MMNLKTRFHNLRAGALTLLVLVFFCRALSRADSGTAGITVDVSQTRHIISPLLFGDQNEWQDQGHDLMQVTVVNSQASLRSDVVNQLLPMGLKVLRYPGGGLSDFFHWEQSTGPVPSRIPQVTTYGLFGGNTAQFLQTPYFGADEFAQLAQNLGADMIITTDILDGTPSEAAAWLAYYENKGIKARYWEIGNEPYLAGSNASTLLVRKTALQYAAIFDAYAVALRAVDPTIHVGIVGCHDNGLFPLCNEANWNQTVLSNTHQKIDFMAVHNSYAPAYALPIDPTTGYQALLAAPQYIRANFALQETDIARYADVASANMTIAVTEHASFWLPASTTTTAADLARNQSLGSALFTALTYNVFMSDARIQTATHFNLTSPYWQAPLTFAPQNPTYPAGYNPQSVFSAYGYILQLYAASAGGTYVPATVTNSPLFNSQALGIVPAEMGIPSLDAVAALMPNGLVYLYVVNRDLTHSITANLVLSNLPGPVTAVSAQQLNGSDITAYNLPGSPNAVNVISAVLPAVSSGTIAFPPHSLTRLTVNLVSSTPSASLNAIQVFPNPLRPARGDSTMHFDNLPAGSRLRVYTLSGEKVRDLTADSTGRATWDGSNGAGQKAASGVYFVYVQGGGDSKTLKVAVQR